MENTGTLRQLIVGFLGETFDGYICIDTSLLVSEAFLSLFAMDHSVYFSDMLFRIDAVA